MNKRSRNKWEKFVEEQRNILVEHIDRFVLRCLNEYHELTLKEKEMKGGNKKQ